ncbi:MAG: hypothetical protein Q4D76_18215 [Oscillospiraceae bacterium]|nr:hypothetical protein [Oscillospiraceae bacterium]
MGKQINFFIDRETEERFLIYIRKNGVAIFEGNNNNPQVVDELPVPFSGKGCFKIYLYKTNNGDLKLKKLSTGRECIDSIESPVIEFSRTIIREDTKEVTKGRLWVETKYYNDNGELVIKNGMLEEWYKDLCKWIKKNAPRIEVSNNGKNHNVYITKQVLQLLEQGYKLV